MRATELYLRICETYSDKITSGGVGESHSLVNEDLITRVDKHQIYRNQTVVVLLKSNEFSEIPQLFFF